MSDQTKHQVGRREFLGAAAAASFMIMNPQRVRGTQANSQVRFGILGCGGRGHAVGTGFVENAGARVTALADLFGDKLEAAQQHYDQIQQAKGYAAIDSAQLFKGPDAYQRIAASNAVDFILITTPPYFHPHHLETVVDAGKHVYCEKPVAVDVPNAHHVIQIGKKAEEKLSLDVGFQIRMAPPMVELTRRLHDGAIGKVGSGQAFYYCAHIDRPDWPGASPAEKRLRNWVWDQESFRRHHCRAEHPRHRHVQLDAAGSSRKSDGHRQPQAAHRRGQLLGQLQRAFHLPGRRPNQLWFLPGRASGVRCGGLFVWGGGIFRCPLRLARQHFRRP